MKIIGILGNYGTGDNEPMPEVCLMADSSLLKDGKPFFVPDFAPRFVAYPTVVAHVCRLGKNIARKFAPRYYDQLTVGLAVEAEGVAGALGHAFDGAAILGDFVELCELSSTGDDGGLAYEVAIDGQPLFSGSTALLGRGIDELIEYVSRYMTLKIGDYIYLSRPAQGMPLAIDTHITATLAGREVLKMKVK